MAKNEGSILISCATSLAPSLIEPNVTLDNSPSGSNVISSSAGQPRNDKSHMNVHMLREKSNSKLKTSTENISDVCSRDEESVTSSNKEQFKDGCNKEEQSNNGNKNCQAENSAHMWQKKSKKDMQSNEPAMLIQHKMSKKQRVPQEDDKNCQSKKYYGLMCADKKHQATKCSKNTSDMQSVTKKIDVQLPKPAVPYEYRRLCSDKNC